MTDFQERKESKIRVSFSVVSHGQGELLKHLLEDFARTDLSETEIIITLNILEDEDFLDKFSHLPIKVIRNHRRQGFGRNHNCAFRVSRGEVFVVANPDIRLTGVSFEALLLSLQAPSVGACAPVVVSPKGDIEDSARVFPSLKVIALRFLGHHSPEAVDYRVTTEPMAIDWAAGMFVAFRRDAFASVGGFDDRYFMYYEDADICLRLQQNGYATLLNPHLVVVHDAQRTSRKNLKYLSWHIRSALRFTLKHALVKLRDRVPKHA
jgi:N-acetylglucosaminyl-diphospho-decaprenol L-rhamnosyltransferase